MAQTTTGFPETLPFALSSVPKLDDKQAGHLRHFHNIANKPDGEWLHMGTLDPEQAFLDAYRYQLATMAYAAGAAHYHRLPAMRSFFKPLMRSLIHKMLLPHVWNYWYLTSQSGVRFDSDLEELRKPWADPIVRENIMYSGHLLLMVSMYAMLFDDDEFERDGSLVSDWNPMFWGMGPERFVYNTARLQDAILKEMERLEWIIAMRYNDIRNNTNVARDVLLKYWPAIQQNKMIAEDGLFVDALHVKQCFPRRAKSVGFTAWAGAYMNAWNSSWVKDNFEKQSAGYITTINGETRIQAPTAANEIRRLVSEEGWPANDASTLNESRKRVQNTASHESIFQQPLFGYVTEWLSESGKEQELSSLLRHIDANQSPCWEDGGLRYPRDDHTVNSKGEWTRMDTFSGNAGIAYSRLNVTNGQKMMWEHPRTPGHFERQPFVDGIDLAHGVDCLRGVWVEEYRAMVITFEGFELNSLEIPHLQPGPRIMGSLRWRYPDKYYPSCQGRIC
nr:hypothetical protein CFP56_32249 [Quercus suber]